MGPTKILAAFAGAVIVAAGFPMAASAQTYGYGYSQTYGARAYSRPYDDAARGDRYAPDDCRTQRQGRTGAGAVIGGGAGAVVGSQLAARGRRTEGSILGGVVGALIGSQVGRGSSNNCEAYRQSGYASPGDYDDRYVGDQSYGYDEGRGAAYGRDNRYAYDRYAPVESYRNTDGCRLAESEVRLPDGRRDTRYVRTCPDQYGRYRVVD